MEGRPVFEPRHLTLDHALIACIARRNGFELELFGFGASKCRRRLDQIELVGFLSRLLLGLGRDEGCLALVADVFFYLLLFLFVVVVFVLLAAHHGVHGRELPVCRRLALSFMPMVEAVSVLHRVGARLEVLARAELVTVLQPYLLHLAVVLRVERVQETALTLRLVDVVAVERVISIRSTRA